MRVLVIHCHPRSDSFGAAVRDAAVAGLTASGHAVELRDLYAEGFYPVLSSHQRGVYFDATESVRGLEDHVAALRRAEGLVLVYPTWWFGPPAMLKGWLDRVWLPGVAFQLGGPKVMVPLLTDIRRIGVVTDLRFAVVAALVGGVAGPAHHPAWSATALRPRMPGALAGTDADG